MSSETKDCPFCAETIKVAAKKCKHCGEFLEGFTRDSIQHEIGFDMERQSVGGHQANIGEMKGGIGQIGDNITVGKKQRDEQYEIALNWKAKGKPRMRGFDLSRRDLAGLNLVHADLKGAKLDRADLSGTNLREADLTEANLFLTNLSEAILSEAILNGRVVLYGAKLGKANLSNATLREVNLNEAILYDVDLTGADLTGARLCKANLSNATLREVNLDKAILYDAILYDVDLTGAILTGANLTGADLTGADLTGARLGRAQYTARTKWPKYFDPKAAGAILVDEFGNPVVD